MNIQIHPCLQLWFNFSRPFQSCLHYGVVLPVDAGDLIIEMGKVKCNLTVQSFDFQGLVNCLKQLWVQNNCVFLLLLTSCSYFQLN